MEFIKTFVNFAYDALGMACLVIAGIFITNPIIPFIFIPCGYLLIRAKVDYEEEEVRE